MKILIITQAFYPGINPRSFRATELAKEFARKGDEVVVYAELRDFDYDEFTRNTKVVLHDIPLRFQSNKSAEQPPKPGLLKCFSRRILHDLFEFPDVEFVWKIKSIIEKENDVDLLITIAYPHPIHWGAGLAKYILKDKFPKIWIADCGDPYAGNKTEPHFFYFKYVERFWGKRANFITVPIKEAIGAYEPMLRDKIRVIPQGFDFSGLKIFHGDLEYDCPHFAYAGIIYVGKRDPSLLLDYLCRIDKDFVFTIYTKADTFFMKYKEKLGNKLVVLPYVPREQLLFELSKQNFLINLTNTTDTQVPSKLIDYTFTQRPFMNISADFKEKETFEEFFLGNYKNACKPVDLSLYDIANVASQFKKIADSLS